MRTSLFKRLFMLILGITLGCMVGEILLRIFNYEGLNLMSKDPLLGQKYKAGIQTIIFDPEANRNVEIRTNLLGFRDSEHNPGATGRKRIVMLGDSFAAGFAVDWEETYPRVIQRTLRTGGEDWESITLAAAGFGTAQEMLAYREYGRSFHPDFVVLSFFAGNDVSDNSSELSSNPRVYFRLDSKGQLVEERRSKLRGAASQWLNEHSRLYLWQKQQFHKLESFYKNRLEINPAHRVFLKLDDQRILRAWEITFALITRLNSLVKETGGKLVVCYIPFSDEVNPDWWKETLDGSPPMQTAEWDLEKPERILSEFCIKSDILFFSPRSSFLTESQHGTRLYFKHGHLNEKGHRTLGEMLAQWILKHR